jgi:hypothetical protein
MMSRINQPVSSTLVANSLVQSRKVDAASSVWAYLAQSSIM